MTNLLPQESESQAIGKRAGRAFQARLPDSWSVTDLAGDTDYGLDFLVQVANNQGQMSASFYLQLKGTTTPKFVNNNTELSHQFKCSTLNYYRKMEPAVMVAVVDLSAANLPRDCPVYYKWLDEDFLDAINDKVAINDTFTIRVSKTDELDEKLDIWPFYRNRLLGRDSLTALRRAVEDHSSTPIAHIDALTKIIKTKPVLLEVSRDDTGAPWITNPEDHTAGKLSIISGEISANRLGEAERLIEELGFNDDWTVHERAEFFSLKGTLDTLRGEDKSAYENFERAYSLFPESRYKLNFFESAFRLGSYPEEHTLEEYISNLDSENYKECVLKAKCLALLKRAEEAMLELDKHSFQKNIIAKLMICTIAGNVEEFDVISSSIILDELNERQRFLFNILIGKRLFFKGINYDYKSRATENEVIPVKGKREYDFKLLKVSLEHIEKALAHAQVKGYPYDTYVLLDVATPLFSFFNNEKKLVSYLEDILKDRPKSEPLIEALLILKFNSGKYDDVIKLIESIDNRSPEHISLLISSHYHLGRKTEVVALTNEYKDRILDGKPQNYDALMCIAALCAYDTLDEIKEQEFLSYVAGFPNGAALSAIYEYIKICNEFPEKRPTANKILYEKYLSLGKPVFVAQQLFPHLDVDDPIESKIIAEVAEEIRFARELYPEECITYAFSLSRNSMWSKLEELCNRIEATRELDNLWALLKASALDGLGRSIDALDLLDSAVSRDRRSFERAENFVTLCVRLGFYAKAAEKLEDLFERASMEKQLTILESLIYIYSSDDEPSGRLIPALLRYGRLIDQEDELLEGKYLIAFLTMTNRPGVDVTNYVEDFRERISRYLTRYPDSVILKGGSLPVEGSGDELIAEMRRLAGISDEQVNTWKKNRNLIRHRRLPVPFALLSIFLDDVGDVFSAWVLSKCCGRDRNEYQLVHSKMMSDLELIGLKGSYSKIVLDETSLLMLNDLDLLEEVLKHVSGIVIHKATYEMFSRASHAVMGSIYASIPKAIIRKLGANLANITLEGSINFDGTLIEQYESILSNVSDGFICTDDLYLSEFLRHDGYRTINTTNIIGFLTLSGAITSEQSVLAVEKMCSFGLSGVSVTLDQIVSSIDYNICSIGGPDILGSGFGAVFDSVFFSGKNEPEALRLLASMFSGYLNLYKSDVEIDGLETLCNLWMLRYPIYDRLNMVTTWFVLTSIITDYIPESGLVARGKGQSRLWSLARKLTIEFDEKYSLRVILSSVSQVILRLDAQKASDAYDKVKMAFVDGSSESDLFSEIYSAKAIEHRIALAEE